MCVFHAVTNKFFVVLRHASTMVPKEGHGNAVVMEGFICNMSGPNTKNMMK